MSDGVAEPAKDANGTCPNVLIRRAWYRTCIQDCVTLSRLRWRKCYVSVHGSACMAPTSRRCGCSLAGVEKSIMEICGIATHHAPPAMRPRPPDHVRSYMSSLCLSLWSRWTACACSEAS
eukprot:334155-Chlamydomonas_euryale.AAC.3